MEYNRGMSKLVAAFARDTLDWLLRRLDGQPVETGVDLAKLIGRLVELCADDLGELTDDQKAEIAELRSRCRASIAELEIQQESKMQSVGSMEELELLRAELTKEKARLEEAMEKKVSAVRGRES